MLRSIAQAGDAAHIGVESFLAFRLQEALAHMVIGAGALEILRAAGGAAIGDALAPAILHGARLARPFAEPSVVVAEMALKPQPDPVDFSDLGPAPWGHVEADQQPVRPAIVFREVGEG